MKRAAFTDAVRQGSGHFERANGGGVRLFLDEIGAADLRVQLRLSRVLQEHEFERVGGSDTLRVDVRVHRGDQCRLTTRGRKEDVSRGFLSSPLSCAACAAAPAAVQGRHPFVLVQHFIRRVAS